MVEGATTYRVEVVAGSDPLRKERWTRSLRDDLAQWDGLTVDFMPTDDPTPGSKSGGLIDPMLVVILGSSAVAVRSLTTLITQWCARERHRTVRITRGDTTLEITGKPDAAQQELAREFMEKFGDDA
ncbi:effector-associated constant component EACC1 [Actinoalloteichus hymeniacidonis]|uniref:Uncharacterized protein n=1 Tax=Actinoalloteichus hymeniacidonis TaxID=340345 RepID=A0AAC9MZ89_9PSEU|nr:hypothetical protein [Actinoalloteichus hymeniacidonis]AOS63691.1 hypothetical protein TL08_14390 [Actinoalloteichus hymeniacidonis]MBB5908256.1 hypothetical protein [Actinoalloteichus hymeniacidonis]